MLRVYYNWLNYCLPLYWFVYPNTLDYYYNLEYMVDRYYKVEYSRTYISQYYKV